VRGLAARFPAAAYIQMKLKFFFNSTALSPSRRLQNWTQIEERSEGGGALQHVGSHNLCCLPIASGHGSSVLGMAKAKACCLCLSTVVLWRGRQRKKPF
jgi:hypothetical protein